MNTAEATFWVNTPFVIANHCMEFGYGFNFDEPKIRASESKLSKMVVSRNCTH